VARVLRHADDGEFDRQFWRAVRRRWLNRDFRDLFAALNEAGAKYLLVGAHAVAFHRRPNSMTTDAEQSGLPDMLAPRAG
jgi:hypothetical protein